jgi:F0F1-type ATP synthase assembly protein I
LRFACDKSKKPKNQKTKKQKNKNQKQKTKTKKTKIKTGNLALGSISGFPVGVYLIRVQAMLTVRPEKIHFIYV